MIIYALVIAVVAAGFGYILAMRRYRPASARIAPAPPEPAPAPLALPAPETAQTAARLRVENDILKLDVRRYANIVNVTQNLIWVRDKEQNIIFCNLAFSEVAEATSESGDLMDLELYKDQRALARKALETGAEKTERRHVIVGGERRLYHIREVPLAAEGITIGFGMNITELEEAQEEIQRHISAQRDLLESSTSAMAIYGRDMRLKFYNFAFVTLWKLDELWLDTEPTYGEILEALREKRKLPEQANFQAFKQQQLKQFTALIEPQEEFFYLPDGKIIRAIAIPHALGGILFVYEDVTDRLALERSYNTLIAVQRETLDNLHEGVAVFAENGRLTLYNPVLLRLWNLEQEFAAKEPHLREVLDRCRPLFVTEDWTDFRANLMARFALRQFFALRFERSNHTVLDCSFVPLPDGATLITFLDITDSSLVERSLREKNEALEAADTLKTEFLANMSYELRSPLTSISGFAEMLAREYAGTLAPAQKEYVEGIYQSAQALGHLISDVIDLATMEAGYLRLEVSEVPIAPLMESTRLLLGERVRIDQVTLLTQYEEGLGHLRADAARLTQILFKLLSNAVRATKAKGKVTVRWFRHEESIALSVQDDGAPIDAAKQAAIFDPFFRAMAGQAEGSVGLGLSLVKRFVELHGGRVALYSAPGEGTTITCYFPQQLPLSSADAARTELV
jgi:signal transduction histidine kinase